MDSPEYTLREDHHDPRMRPSVDLLVHKLRTMKVLIHKPDATEHVIGALAHHKFVFEAEHPDHLLRLAVKMMDLWHLATHTGHQFYFDNSSEAEALRNPEPAPISVTGDVLELPKDVFRAILDDKRFKKAARLAIEEHAVLLGEKYNEITCNFCNVDYTTLKEWAMHVRQKVWEAMNAAFEEASQADGEEASAQASS